MERRAGRPAAAAAIGDGAGVSARVQPLSMCCYQLTNAVVPYSLGNLFLLINGTFGVLQVSDHDMADVAIGVTCPSVDEETGEALSDVRVRLTTRLQMAGNLVATYAYPNTIVQTAATGQVLSLSPEFYEGRIVEYFPDGRDTVMLPGPCYRTDMVIHDGASGGPVAGPTGRIFGINSTGFDGTDDFYISRIDELFSLEIATSETDRITIQELIIEGVFTVDP